MADSDRITPEESARQRAEVIMKVRCGLMTASQAAKKLQISRKTYYKWEQRGLSALLEGVLDQKAGRPEKATVAQESVLEKQLSEIRRENELLRQKMALNSLICQIGVKSSADRMKKK
jgi:transposase